MVSASGIMGVTSAPLVMTPDPPTGFTATYALNAGRETHGVYTRRLQNSDTDNVSVSWVKPQSWLHFMTAMLTARGVNPAGTITAGSLTVSYITGDSTGTAATIPSFPVPGAGIVVVMAGNVAAPETGSKWPSWPVVMGVPTGWTHLAATEKSGTSFSQYSSAPSLAVVGKSFTAAGSTGTISFPTSQGSPAFAALYVFLAAAPDVSASIAAA